MTRTEFTSITLDRPVSLTAGSIPVESLVTAFKSDVPPPCRRIKGQTHVPHPTRFPPPVSTPVTLTLSRNDDKAPGPIDDCLLGTLARVLGSSSQDANNSTARISFSVSGAMSACSRCLRLL